ncbi:MAG: tetratricopeptide repeat protein [Cyanobacteria bacterium P01_F01_bin.150]
MPTLSLCLIAKDEETQLPSCLESVVDIVDEVIVLDTGSTDGTVAIAHQFNAQVYHFDWIDDFAAARNVSLEHASGDWILVLDADEQLVPGAKAMIQQAIQAEDCLVVNLLRQEVGAAQSPYSSVSRLFRKHPKVRFSRPYHAMIDDSVADLLCDEPHWQIAEIPTVMIYHQGYQSAAIAHHNKQKRARVAMEKFLAKHSKDAYVCSKLGALYVQMGEVAKGQRLLMQGLMAINANQQQDKVERNNRSHDKRSDNVAIAYELHYHLGIAYRRQQQLDNAQYHYEQALEQPLLESLKLGAYINLGSLKQLTGDLSSARQIYKQAIAIDPEFVIAHYNLGMTYKAIGQFVEAIAHYQKAIQLAPDYAEAHQNLGVASLKLGQLSQALAAFKQAIALHQNNNPQEAHRLSQALKSMGFNL